ncbi:MAG TPA: nitroreductase family protein [Thermoplasmata archaeon]|nr:nitroreductase family protein [Thermoplasmata archaeon]HTT16481.1 nitroreductase family protein [Thermoplasmata archaeon]
MDVLEAIRGYRPCVAFQSRPLSPETLKTVLSAARLAHSHRNLQPWRFVVVQDDERKRLLAQASPRGKLIAEAPAAIVAFAVEEDIPITIGGYISAYPLDVAVAVDHLQLAATASGLGTNWLIEFNEEKVRSVLRVPEGIHPIAIIPIGFPAEGNGSAKAAAEDGRKSPDEIIAYDAYPW